MVTSREMLLGDSFLERLAGSCSGSFLEQTQGCDTVFFRFTRSIGLARRLLILLLTTQSTGKGDALHIGCQWDVVLVVLKQVRNPGQSLLLAENTSHGQRNRLSHLER